jgi:cation-transporting ATPase E
VTTDLSRGLSATEVAERRARGQTNIVETRTSRTVADILRTNIFTRFNAIISALLVVVLVAGDPRDALFGIVMIVNAVIGIVQELRAKRTLDRLSVLAAPEVAVLRDGDQQIIRPDEVVLDDLVVLRPGDQVVADGNVVVSDGLQLNEALLTGEADPVAKQEDDMVMSGSFVAAGSGTCHVSAVGADAYAQHLTAEAKEFSLANSELRDGIDQILRIVQWLLIPTSALLLWSQLSLDHVDFSQALVSTVAGVVGMVPQGLVLLVSMAFAVAVIRLGRENALVQELPAVETLARVDVVCVDKTGTLTDGRIVHEVTVPLVDGDDVALDAVAALAQADPNPNPTLGAIRAAQESDPGWTPLEVRPFSSATKYAAVEFEGKGWWVIGAPEIVGRGATTGLRERIRDIAVSGRRVLLVASSDQPAEGDSLPPRLEPRALVRLVEEVRPDAADTFRFFIEDGVTPKVISGDNPLTVGAVASAVGIPGASHPVDATDMPEAGDTGFVQSVEDNSIFGRVVPEQKRSMVRALQQSGHTVAMTGDGINDVLALKDADIGIAVGSGASATKAVAQIVLLDDRFSSLPDVVAEGRRVIANMERVAALFVTKTVYATLLAVLIGFAQLSFPFLPRHLTLVGTLTIGIPAFLLSFEPTDEPVRPGFLGRVLRFAIPAGLVAALMTFLVYGLSRSNLIDAPLEEARTAATTTMVLLGLWILIELIRPLDRGRALLVSLLFTAFVLVLMLPAGRAFFELVIPSLEVWAIIAVGVLMGAILIDIALRLVSALARRFGREGAATGRDRSVKPRAETG